MWRVRWIDRGCSVSFESGTSAPPSLNYDEIFIGEISLAELAERAEHMGKMDFNLLMKNCGVLSDSQLKDWLDGVHVNKHPDYFGGFEIIYGFNRDAQHFVVVKNKTPGGPHFALIAHQGASS
jgi:hypothetical protein